MFIHAVYLINTCSSITLTFIRKYHSTFYVGMGVVQNGCLYLRYGSSSVITTVKWDKTPTKSLCYNYYKNATRVLLLHTKAEKNEHKIFDFVILPFFLSSPHITQNLRGYMNVVHAKVNALLQWVGLFWFIAACEPWLVSYDPKHAL